MSIVDKVKGMLGQHGDKAKEGMEKAGDMIDRKTGGKHSDKIDRAQEKAGDMIDRSSGEGTPNERPNERPPEGGRPEGPRS